MFERYTEQARRSIFFARGEASKWGSGQYIETPHLLLGLLRDHRPFFVALLGSAKAFTNIVQELDLKPVEPSVKVSIDLPLSVEAKRVLGFTAEEAERLGDRHIDTGHFILGLLRQPGQVSELLMKKGLSLENVRDGIRDMKASGNEAVLRGLRSAFQAALQNRLRPELEPAVTYALHPEKVQ